MKIIVVYVFPTSGSFYFDGACRFVESYNKHPAGAEHRLIIVSNGGPPTLEMRSVLSLLEHDAEIYQHDNTGYDIGAEQAVAHKYPCDMMVFFGSTAYIRGPGWLKRMAEAFERHGPNAIYGCMANTGNVAVGVWPHIRTTGYFLSPLMLNMYPLKVNQPHLRYEFEHGRSNLTEWFRAHGHQALMVTWHGEYEWPAWCAIPNGFHNGDQSELLTGDKISAPPYWPVP